MGLRSLLAFIVVQALLISELNAKSIRTRRNTPSITVDNNPNKREVVVYSASSPSESKSYHPPLLAAPPAASVARSIDQNPYQPPLILSNNDYKPLISSSQTQSVRYQAPGSNLPLQGLPLAYAQSQPSVSSLSYSAPLLASAQTSNSNAVPRQGFSYSGDHGSLNNFNHQHPPAQAESQPAPSAVVAKAGDRTKDEYVIYYYYYYDNDTSANGSSNFDDIPSLESYDMDKIPKETEKSASAKALTADTNSLNGNSQDHRRIQDGSASSQPRSASSGSANQAPFIRSDRPTEDLSIQPLKPVSNVFRYGTNEVPRFPILPNFVVSEPPVVPKVGIASTPDFLSEENPTTPISLHSSIQLANPTENESDDANSVLDQPHDSKSDDNKVAVEEQQTTTTSTEAPTTTELPTTTTTEKSRRRPGSGNRRRFNPSPNFSSNRRQGSPRSSTSTSTTSTTPSSGISSTRGSFRGSNRVRPRPTIPSSRPRPSFSRNAPSVADNDETKSTLLPFSSSSTPSTTTSTSRPRFGASSAAPRRFSSSRTRSQVPVPSRISSSTTTTTTLRPRLSSRPRPSFVPSSRARAPRPGLFRSRTPEPEETETTTLVSETVAEQESSASSTNQNSSNQPNEESESDEEESSEEEETSGTEAEEPTTTEKSRFSALFRPRNRSTLNRPRPPLARSR